MMYLAIQENADGRPCGWGLASTRKAAIEEAEARYAGHMHAGAYGCYLGERSGALRVYVRGCSSQPWIHAGDDPAVEGGADVAEMRGGVARLVARIHVGCGGELRDAKTLLGCYSCERCGAVIRPRAPVRS